LYKKQGTARKEDSKQSKTSDSKREESGTPANERKASKNKETPPGSRGASKKVQNWLIVLLLIFSLSIIGIGISLFVGNFIPFWLMFGFSLVYSVEKWLYYFTRRHKGLGKLYRLLLNLSILSLLGLLVWSGIKVFSHQFVQSSLAGGLIFIAEFIFFIWMWRVVAKNSWRWPSMKLSVFSLICLCVIFAFAGVQPMAGYKDRGFSAISSFFEKINQQNLQAKKSAPSPTPIQTEVSPTFNPTTIRPTPTPVPATTNKPNNNEAANDIQSVERNAFNLINSERLKAGLSATSWDDKLYQLSVAHTQEMANRGELFHSPINGPIGEDAWGGHGYSRYSGTALAQVIIDSWMSSPLHKAWILHAPLKHSVVSIVSDANGQYASWTFWTSEAGEGPP
jgi:uncharacterized protein YkwD